MKIRVGTVSKEINSTFRPSLTTEIDVQIKDGCSFLSPVLIFNENVWSESYNYCYIPKWNRYYFLHDAVIQGPRWFVTCAVDVLASWRTQILASSAYVARSASDYTLDLPDPTWSHGSLPAVTETNIPIDGLSATGAFLLFTASNDLQTVNTEIPSLSVYILTGAQLKEVCNYLFSGAFFQDATTDPDTQIKLDSTTATLAKTFFNPFQYVIKCMWVPIAPTYLPATQGQYSVNFGWWESQTQAPMVNGNHSALTFSFTLGSYTDWTSRSAGWTNDILYIPGFGHITISPEYQGRTIGGRIVLDLASGKAQLMLDVDNKIFQSATGKLGCDIQLSSLYEDVVNDLGSKGSIIKAGVGAAAGAARSLGGTLSSIGHNIKEWFTGSGNYERVELTAGAGEIASQAVQGAQAALQPSMSLCGINDGMALIQQNIQAKLTISRFSRFADVHTRLGGMCSRIMTLSSLSGYTEVVNPNVEAPATSAELLQISAFLRGGFYIE